MTAYHGGKQRIGKQLAEVIVDESIDIAEEEGIEIKGYCEPFCGMLGVFRHIPELFEDAGLFRLKYKAGDTNESVIKMWKAAVDGWRPPTKCTKKEYENLKYAKASAKKGFVGHQCSFGGKNFRGYVKERCTGTKIQNGSENVREVAAELKNVKFTNTDYSQFSSLKGYIIYCDPPYGKYSDYYDEDHRMLSFDHEAFWQWCREMSKHNMIFISEYNAPKDFELITAIKSYVSYGSNQTQNEERLFFV